jgi:predicted nucleotidyltransferase
MASHDAVNAVRRYLRALQDHGLDVVFCVLYGSWARGESDEESDIDVIVVASAFDGAKDRKLVDLLWRVAARVDSRIEPLSCGLQRWEADRSSVLLEIARQEGVHIAA